MATVRFSLRLVWRIQEVGLTRATVAHARGWLLAVRVALNISESADEATRICEAEARLLALDYSRENLCSASRDAVCAKLKWWNVKDIRDGIDTWVRANAPAVDPLPPEAMNAPISDTGKWLYARYLKASGEGAAVRALSVMRDRETAAFDWLVRGDHTAAAYAVMQGWQPTPTAADLVADWDDEAGIIERAVRIRTMPCNSVYASLIREKTVGVFLMAVGIHAHHHLTAAIEELRSTADPVPVAFPEPETLFGDIV